MKRYFVISPESDDTSFSFGPPDPGRDVVEVEAETKHDALIFGIRLMRQQRRSYVNEYPGENPFAGMTVEEVPDDPGGPGSDSEGR